MLPPQGLSFSGLVESGKRLIEDFFPSQELHKLAE